MDALIYRKAAENVAGEPVSIETDGSVWADSDHRDIDQAAIAAEYDRLVAEQAAQDALAAQARQKIAEASGLTPEEMAALGF